MLIEFKELAHGYTESKHNAIFLWKLRSEKRRGRGGSWSEHIPGISLFSCGFFWAPIKWIQVEVEGWKERLVFKGFTVCSQGRQQLLTAVLFLLETPVVAALHFFFPNLPRVYWNQLPANGCVNLFSIVQSPTVRICVLFSFHYLINKEKNKLGIKWSCFMLDFLFVIH